MCGYISGVAVKVSDEVKVYTLKGDDSHSAIRKHYNIVDDDSLRARYQTPVELLPVRGLDNIEDFDFVFDDVRPDWWTDEMTESAKRQLFRAHMQRYTPGVGIVEYGGNLYLDSLTTISEGVTLSAGGSLYLYSLTTLPEGVTLSAGVGLCIRSLTTISEGVTLSAGGSLYIRSLTTIPQGVTLSAGGGLYLDSLTTIPEGVTLSAGVCLYLYSLTKGDIPAGVTIKASKVLYND